MAAGTSRPDVWTGIALNRDPGDPNCPSIWTPLESSTFQVVSVSDQVRGRDYELAQPMSADPTLLIRDPNEYLNPDNPSSPYAGQVKPYREVCQLCQWPVTGAGSTGNLINSGTWRGSRVDAYDPSFEIYTDGAPAPNWMIRNNVTAAISTVTPRTGTKSVRYAVSDFGMGIGFGVPVIPGRQYTTSLYVRQDAANTQRIYVGGTTACHDLFGRTTANGWGTPTGGAAYTVAGTAANYSVAPGVGTQVNTAASTPRFATTGTFYQAYQYLTVTAPVLATGGNYVVGTVVRFADASNHYRCGIEFKTDTTIGLLIEKVVAGVTSTVDSLATTLTYTAGDTFELAFTLYAGSALEAHVWPAAKQESLAATTGFTTDTSITADGAVGCFSYRAAGNTNANLPAAFANYRATGTIAGSSTSANGSYQRLSVTYTADTPGQPALVDQVFTGTVAAIPIGGLFVYVATQGTTVAANVNVDDIQHEQAASASAFTTAGPVIYPLFRNLAERYPRGWAARGYEGFAAVPCVDALSALNKIFIHDEATQAILSTQPDFYYPLSDGADTGLFLDQSGNGQIPLTPYVSKYGAGTPLEPGTAIPLPGQPGASGVQITAVNAGTAGRRPGTALQLAQALPAAVPPASGWAMSFACWTILSAAGFGGEHQATLLSVSNSQGNGVVSPLITLYMNTTTQAKLDVSFQAGGSSRSLSISSPSPIGDGAAHHFAFTIRQDPTNTKIVLWVDGIPDDATQATSIFGYLNVQARTVTLGVDTGGSVGALMNGVMAHAAIWNREITDSEVQSMLDAARFGFEGELSGGRIMRHLQTGGYYGPTRISSGFLSTAMGIPSFSPTIDLLTDTLNTTQAEMGTVWVQPDGVLAFETRQDRWLRLTPSAVIGENAAGGEIPYLEGIVFDHDPTYVFPVVTWTREGGSTALGGAPAARLAAARAFFPRQFDGTNDLNDDATAQYLADWVFYSHRAPLTRVAELEFDPWANPDLWPLVLSLEVGQRVAVKRRASSANAGAGLTMSADYFIEKVGTPQLSFKRDEQVWTVTLALSPIGVGSAPNGPTMQPWILEHATYGVLDSTTVLGW